MAKTKPRRTVAVAVGLAPTDERHRHGGVVRLPRVIEGIDGSKRTEIVWQGLSTLETMLDKGSITPAMAAAGEQFHDTFRLAGLDGLFASDILRAVGGGSAWRKGGGNETARQQIGDALDALGGPQTPGGSCAWYVLGCEYSLRQWVLTATWARGRIDHRVGAGILIQDLALLQAYWGL